MMQKYTTSGRMKNNMPPQAERPKAKKIPARESLINEDFPLQFIIPETNRYIARNPKKKPSGSDLNHPTIPLVNIGTEIENINADKSPAVVPPKTRTNAKTTIDVSEPTTNGNNIVKLYNDCPNPNRVYKIPVVRCNVTCEFSAISLPNGCQDFSSTHPEYAS